MRLIRLMSACIGLVLVSATTKTSAAELKADAINAAPYRKDLPAHQASATGLRLQVLLDRAHFSPGEIDGKFGDNAKKALRAYAEAQHLQASDTLTEEVWNKLAADNRAIVTSYTLTKKDVAGPFLRSLPAKMEAMKLLPRMGYTSAREALAEKFHVSQALLAALNPHQHFDRAGDSIAVIDTNAAGPAKAQRLEVDKRRQTVKAFDDGNQLVGFFPATVGSEDKPSPSGDLKVVEIDRNPNYRYNPKYRFKGVHAREPFTIRPGPNNPVGTVWIQLDAEGYGLHGTPDPSKVSKAQSHGCVRLTNWDAERLASAVAKGTPVGFVATP